MSISSHAKSHVPAEAGAILGRVPLWVWLAGPYALVLVVVLVVPLLHLMAFSAMTHHPRQMFVPELTSANYLRLLDAYYFEVLVRTLRISAVTMVLAVLLGTPLAYWLARCRPATLAVGLFFVVMPMMVSTVVRAFGWMILLGRNGVINAVSVDLGIGRWLFVMNTETAVVIALVQICLPLVVLPAMASFEKIPVMLEEAATNLGATPLQLFSKVLVPMALPGIGSGALLAFVVAVSVVVTPALMGGRTSRMVGNEIYDQVVTALNWPFASAMAMVLIVIVLAMMAMASAIAHWYGRRSAASGR